VNTMLAPRTLNLYVEDVLPDDFRTAALANRALYSTRQADEILDPQPVGKRIALGLTYAGGLKAKADNYLSEMKQITGGLTLGHTLGPSPLTQLMNLGRTWAGENEPQARSMGLDELANALGYVATSKNGGQMFDGFGRISRACDSITDLIGQRSSAAGNAVRGVGEAVNGALGLLHHAGAGVGTHWGGGSDEESDVRGLPGALASLNRSSHDQAHKMNQDNRKFWANRKATATSDAAASADVVEGLRRQIQLAMTTSEQIAAMNRYNRARYGKK